MAFFGITALGPQNSFQTHLIDAIGLKLFTMEEFKSAFDRIDSDRSGFIELDEVERLLSETYQMQPLEEEVIMFMEEFDTNRDGRVSWEEFCSAMTRIKENLESKAARAAEIKSHEQWNYNRRKHIRLETDTIEKYRKPLTYGQQYGFYNPSQERSLPTATRKTFYKSRCDETRYADSMIAGGHHFT